MAVSVFYSQHDCLIDAVNPTFNGDGYFDVGVVRVGGAKTFQYNELQMFDLNAPDSGPTPPASITVESAELWGLVNTALGVASTYNLNRLDDPHAAYIDSEATWTNWKNANAWSVGGGDIATPPATVSYAHPSTTGDQLVIAGLGPLVLDALASRAGLLRVVHQQNPIVGSPDSSTYVLNIGGPGTATNCRLILTWHDPSLDIPNIDHPQASTMLGARPPSGSRPASAGAPSPPARPQHPTRRQP